ncbi:hypothetical protein [Bacillus mycoides]|uniref:hypothetical protein n=1 Tax=Bacillus mycoides TaxID=1405 RepID=UPI003A809D60
MGFFQNAGGTLFSGTLTLNAGDTLRVHNAGTTSVTLVPFGLSSLGQIHIPTVNLVVYRFR